MDAEDDRDEVLRLEREGWRALAGDGDPAAFYDRVLAPEVQMLLPGGLVIDDRQAVVESMGGAPWERYELHDERVLPLGEGAAVVTYRATARRQGTDYTALFASTYVREDGTWKLVVHQQTPA